MDPSRTELLDKIKAQGDVVRQLKEKKAESSVVRLYLYNLNGLQFKNLQLGSRHLDVR